MRINISKYHALSSYNYKNNIFNVNSNKSFKGNTTVKTIRNTGMSIATLALFNMACTNKTSNTQPETDTVEISDIQDNTDNLVISEAKDTENTETQKRYHYLPSENEITADDYSWSETIYPDGKIEKDSMVYKITITPDGKRTSVQTETDENGHTVITTIFPDGTKTVKTEYKLNNLNEILYTTKTFRADESLKSSKFYNEYPADSTDNSLKITEERYEEYNENNILIRWHSSIKDEARNEKNNEYDNHNRLIYDDVKNEIYMYRGENKLPFQSVSKYDDCRRITEYNSDGSVKNIYYKASDGTITEENDSL